MKKKILIFLMATVLASSAMMSGTAATVFASVSSSSTVEEWVQGKTYVAGDIVTYNGKTFKCSWWTNTDKPGASQWGPWVEITGTDPDPEETSVTDPKPDETSATEATSSETDEPSQGGIPEWVAGKVYVSGNKVVYKSNIYQCKWWTTEVPSASEWGAWKFIGPVDPETSETTPSETIPSETIPSETIPSETTPSETTPSETTPSETTPSETTPSETTPSETTPSETTPSETEKNTPPVISGVFDKTIKVGDAFNAMDGVKALDKEDGDLTSKITVTGKVDTAKVGTYTLVYNVTDSKAEKASATAVIKVEAADIDVPSGEYDQTSNVNGIKYPDGYWNRKVVGYFPNYAINSESHAKFSMTDLQWDKLTHIQYAFVIADEQTLELVPSDPENDVNSKFEGRKFTHKGKEIKMDDSLGYYGQFNLMHTMKEMYPDVTVLASTGGWAASRSLWLVTDNEANMNKFADSAVKFVRKYGFDGIDIDFEFPSETSQSGNPADFDLSETRRAGISERYAKLIKILRDKFDAAAKQDGTYYWVTSAVSASSWVLGGQTSADYLDYLDFVSIMSYDYHGGWNQFVENQANIHPDPADTETNMKTLGFDWSFNYYRGVVQSEKILMGIPYYTRGWANVQGGTNGLHGSSKTPATGIDNIWHDLDANGKEIPAGANPLWHVLNLMNEEGSNYKKYWDPVGCVPYIWNNVTKTFLTFEDQQSVQERINYVKQNNLGGVLIWVMHGDYDYDVAQDKYVVGDTLTTMLHDQFEKMAPAKLTSDIKITDDVLDFDVSFTGKYDHPNYQYALKVTNRSGQDFDKWTISFDIPNSAKFTGSWSGIATTKPSEIAGFTTVTIDPGWQKLPNGASVSLDGMIYLNFSGVKNFKLNGKAMKSEIQAEIARLYR